jgi:hypothetical protein
MLSASPVNIKPASRERVVELLFAQVGAVEQADHRGLGTLHSTNLDPRCHRAPPP